MGKRDKPELHAKQYLHCFGLWLALSRMSPGGGIGASSAAQEYTEAFDNDAGIVCLLLETLRAGVHPNLFT